MIIQILRLEQCDLENGVPTEWFYKTWDSDLPLR